MLRPSFARKVVRLRTAQYLHATTSTLAQRYVRVHVLTDLSATVAEPEVVEPVATETQAEVEAQAQPSTSAPSGILSNGLPDPRRFPLYRPPPPPPEREPQIDLRGVDLNKIDLDKLPTFEEIDVLEKEQITEEAIRNVPEYTEDDLRAFYKSVVLSGAAEAAKDNLPQIAAPEPRTTHARRRELLAGLTKRLLEPSEGEVAPLVPALDKDVPQHMALTAALMKVAPEMAGQLTVPVGLVTGSEWRALFDSFVSTAPRQILTPSLPGPMRGEPRCS